MNVDLSLLNSDICDFIDITGEYTLDKNYYEKSDIISINNIDVIGKVIKKTDADGNLKYYISAIIKGVMYIPDSISLEKVEYPFSIEYDDFIDENAKKDENTLDIFQFLWENIVLEVPLQFTKVEDLSKFHGDGWKLISEDELIKRNNPFNDLLKELDKE